MFAIIDCPIGGDTQQQAHSARYGNIHHAANVAKNLLNRFIPPQKSTK